jgi:hypothetical protein
LDNLGIDRRTILKTYVKEMGYEDADWIHLPKVRVQWQAVVRMVMNLRVP